MNLRIHPVILCTLLPFSSACQQQPADAAPSVRIGDSVCDQCNMIISDERWATATIAEGPRGAEPRLFDDFNCQVNYEAEHPQAVILTRWSHCYTTTRWIPTSQAAFLISPSLRSPMGSYTAAFSTMSHAESAEADLNGEVMVFESAWERLRAEEITKKSGQGPAKEEHHNEP